MNQAQPRRHFDVIGIGECMVEFHATEALASATTLQPGYGGDVLNALVAVRRLGGTSGFVTRVGDDPFGPALLAAWRGAGVDTSGVLGDAGENGIYFISVDPAGEREFTYRRAGSAASRLAPEDIDAAYIAQGHWLLLSGITQALSGSARAATLAAARVAGACGVRVAYDPNYRPRLWQAQGGLAAARAAFDEIAALADLVLPSHPADAILLDDVAVADDGVAAARALARKFAQRARQVALKCGAHGCVLAGPGELTHVPAVAAARVRDTTGAGDCWNGSFLLQLRRGASAAGAAALANGHAAAKLAYRGAIPGPGWPD